MKTSPLAAIHERLEARTAEFAGWDMPILYDGIVSEHKAVRSSVGAFDISHMGQFVAKGENVAAWLNGILTNDTSLLADTEGQYTLMLNEQGGVIDDMIIYREAYDQFLLVVNASRVEQDLTWLQNLIEPGITLHDESEKYGGIAVQGPETVALWEKLNAGCDLPSRNGIVRQGNIILCRTGYTGEDGFELFAPIDEISDWFDRLLDAGAKPCGLGARDTLRLEKCYPLNGNDLDPAHTPLEAGLGFFVKLEKPFIGSSTLKDQKAAGLTQRLVAIKMTGKSPPPRHGYEVIDPETGEPVGELSSGSLSPTLGIGIGLAYLPKSLAKIGTVVQIEIRNRQFPAEVVKKPFL